MKLLQRWQKTHIRVDQPDVETATGEQVSGGVLLRATLRRSGERIELVSVERRLWTEDLNASSEEARVPSASPLVTPAGNGCCIAALPGIDVMTRCFAMPRTDPARMRQMVAHRLEADLPIPLAGVVWDCRCAGEGGSNSTVVLAQAARTDRIDQYYDGIKQQGMRVDMLTTEAEALSALWRHGLQPVRRDGSGIDGIVLAASGAWLVAVMEGDLIRSVRRVAFDPADPEGLCRSCRQAIEAEQPLHKLRSIQWLATSEVDELRFLLAERLETQVVPMQTARELIGPDGGPVSEETLAAHGPAVGLALVGLFERQHVVCLGGSREGGQVARRWWDRWLTRPERWAAAAVGLAILAGAIHWTALSSETGRMTQLVTQSNRPDSAMAQLEPQIRVLERIRTWRLDVEGVVAALCAKIPSDMVISSLQLSRERGLTIKGTCGNSEKIYKLVEDLRKSPWFIDVQPGRTEPGRGGVFTITADIAGTRKLTVGPGGRRR